VKKPELERSQSLGSSWQNACALNFWSWPVLYFHREGQDKKVSRGGQIVKKPELESRCVGQFMTKCMCVELLELAGTVLP
jgi:hypothetical protein